jgi:septum formation protein
MQKIILASTSPRRKELLEKIGLKFSMADSGYEENMNSKKSPKALAKFLSAGKAEAVASKLKSGIVIGCDTIVVLGKEIIGKPENPARAKKVLSKLSGKTHLVVSGITVIDAASKKKVSRAVETKVYFKKLSPAEIEGYVATGDPIDKAGAYGIQTIGAVLVKKVDGDYNNVMGLPISELADMLKNFKITIF